jgi:hypothetical protein
MGALLVYFVIGSVVSVPILGYHLLRTRRELSELRAELRRRGLIGPGAGAVPSSVGAPNGLPAAPPVSLGAPPQRPDAAARLERDGLPSGGSH